MTSGTGRQRAGRMAPDDRRAAIVAATLPLVLEHGAGISTRQIAEAADVAEGTLFRVFPDKEALMNAVLRQGLDPDATLRAIQEIDRSLPLRERLEAAVEVLAARLRGVMGLLHAMGIQGPPPQTETGCERPSPAALNDRFRAAVVNLVGPDEHLLRISADELAHVTRLLVFSSSHPMINDGRALSASSIVTILLDGLLARPEPDTPRPDRAHHHTDDSGTEVRPC
ncbi:MAG: TetR/AcrR family transcriptional regulator [Pseudonocardia sp.]|nr:TetR/AcrR family transcriptional regulator [Pseudonocardia sp.]